MTEQKEGRKEKFALPQQGQRGEVDRTPVVIVGAFQTKLCLGLFFLTGAGDNTAALDCSLNLGSIRNPIRIIRGYNSPPKETTLLADYPQHCTVICKALLSDLNNSVQSG